MKENVREGLCIPMLYKTKKKSSISSISSFLKVCAKSLSFYFPKVLAHLSTVVHQNGPCTRGR